MSPAARIFQLASPGGPTLPDTFGDELAFHRMPATVGPAELRLRLGGRPFALLGQGPAIPAVLALSAALLPTDPPSRLFLLGDGETDADRVAAPVPVTYFGPEGMAVPGRLRAYPGLIVRPLPEDPAGVRDVLLLGIREDLGSWDPSRHYTA
jgi:hypothetical protein